MNKQISLKTLIIILLVVTLGVVYIFYALNRDISNIQKRMDRNLIITQEKNE